MRRPKAVARLAVLFPVLILAGCSTDQPSVVQNGEVQPLLMTPSLVVAKTISNEKVRAVLERSKAEMDSTHARLEHIEGLLHLVNALDAWELQQHALAGKELQTAADNLERGAKFAHFDLSSRAFAAVANARAAGRRMQQAGHSAGGEFLQATDELDAELRALGARVGRKT